MANGTRKGSKKKQNLRQKNNPKTIPSLEMFGSLILTHFLLLMGGKALLRTQVSLQPGQHLCTPEPQKTKQMPTSAFLMQLIVMLHRAGVQLAPSHMNREISTSGLMNLPIHTSLGPGRVVNYQGARPFPISNFYSPSWTANH